MMVWCSQLRGATGNTANEEGGADNTGNEEGAAASLETWRALALQTATYESATKHYESIWRRQRVR